MAKNGDIKMILPTAADLFSTQEVEMVQMEMKLCLEFLDTLFR